nr:DUF2752 domain-containing protein [bacterium]
MEAACLVAAAIGGAVLLYRLNPSRVPFIICPLRALTGLRCPACGLTRAAHALLHLDIAGMLRYNLLSPLIFAGLAMGFVRYLFRRLRGMGVEQSIGLGLKGGLMIAGILVLFGIVRNVVGI